ncbi:MAG: hypothetical protein NC899_06020, partial [Candidatus Omnitrophica bacterium]|nr:hypothetical protein [Candidatus Omnitrophota bacterium]
MRKILYFLFILIFSIFSQTRYLAPIYPVDNAIKIDGEITDWEWAPTLGKEKFSFPIIIPEYGIVAKFWLRYDKDNLYFAISVDDTSPCLNNWIGSDRWQGDQVELLLCTDPKNHEKHTSYTEYDYQLFLGPDKEGNINCYVNINQKKKDYILPGSEVKIKIWSDKKGYDLEAKIPFESLNKPEYFKPEPGVNIGFQIQVDFSTSDGKGFLYGTKWYPFGIHFQNPSAGWGYAKFLSPGENIFAEIPEESKEKFEGKKIEIKLNIPKTGYVSLNLVNEEGVVVSRILVGEKMEKGENSINWNGVDEYGKVIKEGKYKIKGVVSDIKVKYVTSLGNTSPEPYGGCRSSKGGEYRHGVWHDVIVNQDGSFYILNEGGEGPPSIQLIDPKDNFYVKWGGTT